MSYRRLFVLVGLLVSSASCFAQAWTGVLAPSRATNWTQAGIPNYSNTGALPSDNWKQCGPTIAAYGSKGSSASPSVIVKALNHSGSGYTSCGSNTYVLLGAGDFYLNSGIRNVGLSNVELRGSGPTQTRLHFNSGSTCQGGNGSCLIGFEDSIGEYPSANTAAYNWTGGYSQGSTSITLSSGTNIQANSTILVLDQCDTGYSGTNCSGKATDNGNFFNCEDAYSPGSGTGCSFNGANAGAARPHRFQVEMVEATACSPSCGNSGATTVTITPGLQHPNWAASQSPQVWLIQPSRYVGIRNLLIDGSATTASSATAGPSFFNAANYWVRNVTISQMGSIGVYAAQDVHGDVSGNYFYAIGQNNSNADPSGINYTGSNNLFANNIFQSSKISTFGNGPNNGNVIAYNYVVNAWTGDGFLFGSLWDGHSNGADYNLFEGNVLSQVFQDQTHGTHLMQTWYRNFFTGFESCANGQCGSNTQKTNDIASVEDLAYNRYGNWIGNVLGTPGVETAGYQSSTNEYVTYSSSDAGYPWVIGSGNTSGPPNFAGGPIPLDPLVGSTMLRWGNWDAYSGQVKWNTSEVPSPIGVYPNPVPSNTCTSSNPCPSSFYFSARPSWWSSSIPFPAIGPDVTGGNVGQVAGAINSAGKQSGTAAIIGTSYGGNATNSAWDGHLNATPAMSCYLKVMGGLPDGTSNQLSFDGDSCYNSGSAPQQAPTPPTGLTGTVH